MDSSATTTPETAPRSRVRRRLAWAAIVLLLLTALVLTPPLLNANRLQRRIAASMSEALGRPVHLGEVTLHLLPVPGFTLSDLVVSEDPAFGSEPTIRANTVELRLRISSLWHRQVECSSIRFVDGASLNLVRNPAGRWNLESLLMAASHVESAPTVQAKPGPAPRFPYIEVVGGRVNLKLGDDKQPFSLTEADFALWQPEPGQWRVRLEAKPARTDADIRDPGTLRLEGTLERAAKMTDVPVDLKASWYNAQLGEASRIVTGEDAGWRGTLNADVALAGPLGAARLDAKITTNDLRRADFVPARSLNLTLTCSSAANVAAVMLANTTCTLPTSGPEPLQLTSASVDLQRPREAAVSVVAHAVPVTWALDWARLFSQRMPADLQPAGAVEGTLLRPPGVDTDWTGDLVATLPQQFANADAGANAANPLVLDFVAKPNAAGPLDASHPPGLTPHPLDSTPHPLTLALQPVTLHLPPSGQVLLSGEFTRATYDLRVAGSATQPQLSLLGALVPPLADSIAERNKPGTVVSPGPRPIAMDCRGAWNNPPVCEAPEPTPVAKPKSGRRGRRTLPHP